MRRKLIVLGVFLVLGLVVYAPSLAGPFQFDDKRVILDPKVRERRDSVLSYVGESVGLARDAGGPLGTRSLVHASFLMDWKLWGQKTWPYHVENVVIHVFASWLVFVLIRQILAFSDQRLASSWLPVFGGLVFLLHPVQTQAVAYISQRFESMSAMFYLAAIVLYLKARTTHRGVTYFGSWLAGLAAMSSKEMAITLPIMLVLVETLVIRKKLNWRNWAILGAFFLLAMKIPVQVLMSADLGGQMPTVGDVGRQLAVVELQPAELTRISYGLTQLNVIKTYLRLLVVPIRQSIDYDYPLSQSLGDWPTPISAAILLSLVVVAVWLGKKGETWLLLAVAWFLINLLLTSSIIPIRDVIYEHRLYLSLAGYVIFLVYLIYKLYLRYRENVVIGGVILLVIYAVLTLARNTVWASELKLWEDAWKKAPDKPRTNKNYGFVLTQEKRFGEGIVRLERAVELNPEDQDYRITLGAAYLQVQDWEKARAQFEKASQLRPDKADGWNNLGVALFQLGKYEESKAAFNQALVVEGEFQMAWLGLGGVEIMLENVEAAVAALEKAIALDSGDPRAYSNLVSVYLRAKDWQKAWEALLRLERVAPNYPGLAEKRVALEKKLRQPGQ